MIPADVRILSCKDLFVSQSSLTGESEPLEKFDRPVTDSVKSPLELSNLAFLGSNVISGSAACIVLATGDYTCFGSMLAKGEYQGFIAPQIDELVKIAGVKPEVITREELKQAGHCFQHGSHRNCQYRQRQQLRLIGRTPGQAELIHQSQLFPAVRNTQYKQKNAGRRC